MEPVRIGDPQMWDRDFKSRSIGVDASNVECKSVNQILHVKGTVKTPDDLNELQDMLLNVRGVMGVSSEVTVEEGEIGTPVE